LDYKAYGKFLSVNSEFDDYRLPDKLTETEMFKEYKEAFDKSSEIKNLKKKSYFKKYSAEEKKQELTKRFYNYCKDIEKEKFLYFMLCLGDAEKEAKRIEEYYKPQQTVIVKTGNTNDLQKEFLGYEFLGKKGQEGIRINNYGGKLFDTENYLNPQKANSYIRKYITEGFVPKISEVQKEHTSTYQLVDLLDFEKIEFDKIIKTVAAKKMIWKDIWGTVNLKYLSEIAEIQKGTSITEAKVKKGTVPVVAGGQSSAYSHNKANRQANTITISASGAYAGYVNYWTQEIFASDCTTVISKNEDIVPTKVIYEFLKVIQNYLYELQRGQAQPHVYPSDIEKIKIPVPPTKIQEKIVSEIEKVEQKESKSFARIKELEQELQETIKNIKGEKQNLKTIADIQKGTSITKSKTEKGEIPVIAGGQQAAYFHNEYNREKDIITVSASGAYSGFINYWNEPIFASDCTTIKTKDENSMINKLLYYILKSKQEYFYSLQKGQAQPHVYGKDFQNLEIPLPSIEEQQKLIKEIDKKEAEINKIKNSLSNIQEEKEDVLRKYL
jgi:type I restriction enzyme M protein